jgi:hypothetical protein
LVVCGINKTVDSSDKRGTIADMAKQRTSHRLTPEACAMLDKMAKRDGISRASVLELLIRREAAQTGLGFVQVKKGGAHA